MILSPLGANDAILFVWRIPRVGRDCNRTRIVTVGHAEVQQQP